MSLYSLADIYTNTPYNSTQEKTTLTQEKQETVSQENVTPAVPKPVTSNRTAFWLVVLVLIFIFYHFK